MNYFSIPSDFKFETIQHYTLLNQKYEDTISEVYGQLNNADNEFGSGRPSDQLPVVEYEHFKEYVALIKKYGIGFNYTMNTTCLSNQEFTKEGQRKIITFLKRLVDAGVESITVCMPSLIELITQMKLPLRIKGSTVGGVINAEKAIEYLAIGASRIVADESVNRDFETLKKIIQVYPQDLELIVNVICDMNCIYRPFHHNQMSHDYEYRAASVQYYSHRCNMRRTKVPENILKMNFIRPEDMTYYERIGVHHFKIQGRQAVLKGDILRTVEAYMKKNYEGDLLDLLDCFSPTNSFRVRIDNKQLNKFIDPFLQAGFCKRNCVECNYCKIFCQQHLPYREIEYINQLAMDFYNDMDEYRQNINEWRKSNGFE